MPVGRTIDIAPLNRLLHLAGPSDAPALTAALLLDLRSTEAALDQAWNGPDFAALRAQAHVLIALAGTIGDTELQKLAQRLNVTAHAQNLSSLMEMKQKTMAGLADLIGVLLQQQHRLGA
jgi:two-component system, OmpR family, aerobic respiration control sensor histidine kinase ArcB